MINFVQLLLERLSKISTSFCISWVGVFIRRYGLSWTSRTSNFTRSKFNSQAQGGPRLQKMSISCCSQSLLTIEIPNGKEACVDTKKMISWLQIECTLTTFKCSTESLMSTKMESIKSWRLTSLERISTPLSRDSITRVFPFQSRERSQSKSWSDSTIYIVSARLFTRTLSQRTVLSPLVTAKNFTF